MARTFASTGTPIDTSIGGCNIDGNDMSMFAIARRTDSGRYQAVVTTLTSGAAAISSSLGFTSNNTISNQLSTTTGQDATNIAANVAAVNTWCIMGWTHGAASSPVRFHLYSLGDMTNTWNRENSGNDTGTSTPGSSGIVRFGQKITTEKFAGDIECVAVWDRALTDAQVDTLPLSLQAWFAQAPVGLWLFDQGSTSDNVVDWTGNGANQTAITGTSVATTGVTGWNRGADIWNLLAPSALPLAFPPPFPPRPTTLQAM